MADYVYSFSDSVTAFDATNDEDYVVASDVTVLEMVQERIFADTVTAADAATAAGGPEIDEADSVTAADATTAVVEHVYGSADTVAAVDTTLLEATYERVVAENPVAVDTIVYVDNEFLDEHSDSVSTADGIALTRQITLVFADTTAADDNIGKSNLPTVALISPPNGGTGVSPDAPIVLLITDGLDKKLSLDSIKVTVNSITAWQAQTPVNGWAAQLLSTQAGQWKLTLFAPFGFAYGSVVNLSVDLFYGAAPTFNEQVSAADTVARA